jgi:uncharacterized protein (DUF433 family)
MIIAPHIEVDNDLYGSEPLIAGTRIKVSEVMDLVSAGMTERDMRKHLGVSARDLTNDAIAAAVAFSRDSFCTPKHIADLLPVHDWDPCSNPHSHIRALRRCCLEHGQNGLEVVWNGVLWCNGPFSNLMPFVEKLAQSPAVTAAGFLVNVDSSTAWWRRLTEQLECIFFFDKRIQFDPAPGVKTSTNNKPQALIAHRAYLDLCDPKLFELGSTYERRRAA